MNQQPPISNTMATQFMQRAAASAPIRSPSTPASISANSPQEPNGNPAKRQKLSSPSVPQSPDCYVSTPGSPYTPDGLRTPLAQESTRPFNPQNYIGNAAETPWVLTTLSLTQQQQQQQEGEPEPEPEQHLFPPDEDPSFPLEPVLGRRTFGNFKKKATTSTTKPPAPKHDDRDNDDDASSLSSGELSEDYEQYAARTSTRRPPSTPDRARGNGNSNNKNHKHNKRRDAKEDDSFLDKINLKKLQSGGISAAAGMRPPRAFDARRGGHKRKR